MQIIGNGFVAGHLSDAFADRFPEVTAYAAGVSSTSVTDPAQFDREAELLYDMLRDCRRRGGTALFFSTASFAMYGFPAVPGVEDGPLFPPTVYGRHKLALESAVRSAGVEFLILRPSHLVGSHQRSHQLIPALAEQVQRGRVTVLRGAHRDLLDVQDLMRVIGRLLADGVRGVAVNVASGAPQPVESVVDGIERRLGMTAERVELPGAPSITLASIRRVQELVPGFRAGLSGPEYLDLLLDTYLPCYTDSSHPAGPARAGIALGRTGS